MVSNRLGLAVIGLVSVVAAGTGGYVAMRQTDRHPAMAAAAPAQSTPASAPVQESEAPVTDSAAPESAAPVASAPAAAPGSTPEPAAPPVAAPPSPKVAAPVTAPEPQAPSTPQPAKVARTDKPKPAPRSARAVPSAPTVPATTPADTRVASASPQDPVSVPRAEPQTSDVPSPSPSSPDVATHQEPTPAERQRQLEDVVVPADSVIGLQIETSVSSETARIEDRVDARVTRDVSVDGRVAIPAGARLRGAVTLVDRGGKVRDRSRLGVRFHTLVLADGTTMTIQTDAVYREGDSPAQASAAKIGGAAIGGAILGAIMGGARGAVIGGTTGAAGGTAAVMAGSRKPAALPAGTSVTVRVLSPVTVTVEN